MENSKLEDILKIIELFRESHAKVTVEIKAEKSVIDYLGFINQNIKQDFIDSFITEIYNNLEIIFIKRSLSNSKSETILIVEEDKKKLQIDILDINNIEKQRITRYSIYNDQSVIERDFETSTKTDKYGNTNENVSLKTEWKLACFISDLKEVLRFEEKTKVAEKKFGKRN